MLAEAGPVGSLKWTLHPGDFVVAREINGGYGYEIVFRTPSEIEMQHHLKNVHQPVLVFQVKGAIA